MIDLDYSFSLLNEIDLKKYEEKIKKIIIDFENHNCLGHDYLGWYDLPKKMYEQVKRINDVAKEIKNKCSVFVVCGIGGSYLGARAVIEAIKGFYKTDVEILYMGNTFDDRYTRDVLEYLEDKDFCINVISKSGTTMETAIAFRFLKDLLYKKYGEDGDKRIYVTTDESNGCLRRMTTENGYCSFVIPGDVGGRFSVFSPVGLLPLAVAGVDILEFLNGARTAMSDFKNFNDEENIFFQYAAYRYHQYIENKKNVEIFVSYSPYLNMIAEWWKQLFGESEGKDNKGLYPASVNFSTDLHSLGQFIQQGSKIFFITQLKVEETDNLMVNKDVQNSDGLNYLDGISLGEINKVAQEGTNKAHYYQGKVDCLTIKMEKVNENNVGYLLYFMMISCMISAYLLEVNPFNQPGVEFYKQEMKKILKKE